MDAVVTVKPASDLLDAAAARKRLSLQLAPYRLDLRAEIQSIAAVGASKPARLFHDVLQVAHGPGHLSTHEYFYYRLYDPALSASERLRYLGKSRLARLHAACNDAAWRVALEDKPLCYIALAGAGLPVPRTQAVYTRGGRNFGTVALRDPGDLKRHLREPSHYPLFLKTIDGLGSIGALSLAGVDGDWIDFTTGETSHVDDVIRFVNEFGGEGFLLQDRLEPHHALSAAFGPTLPTIRFLLLQSGGSVRVESAVVKIPLARNPADNYWRPGNMLGSLDDDGRITRVVTGAGATLRALTHHPETAAPLIGLHLPLWEEASDLCREAAALFPRVRTQSWDVAVTDTGAVLVEGNEGGAINLHQLAHCRGALTESFREHVRNCGCRLVN